MGSLVPFQDLNLQPGPSTTTATTFTTTTTPAATATATIFKIPKPEPLDEPPQTHFQTPPFTLNPFRTTTTAFASGAGAGASISSVVASASLSGAGASSSGAGASTSGAGPSTSAAGASTSAAGEDGNVYAEYNRISEMFRHAFAARMQTYGETTIVEQPDNSQAIVPYNNNEETQLSNVVVSQRRKYPQRSGELVRVTDLGPDDELYFRNVIRRTRKTYDALRLMAITEDEMNREKRVRDFASLAIAEEERSRERRVRGDLKAAAMLRDRGLWLNRDKRIVGAIPGIFVGDVFFWRMELCVIGLHGQVQAGIDHLPASQSSNGEPIATSVIVSGGYEDDEDGGDVIIYTGQGGQDKYGRQCVHQKLESGNLALERSMYYGIEVRVIRGFKYEGSPSGKVYVYDGLFRIVETWFDVGRSGFGVYKFRLVRMENQPEMGTAVLKFAQNLRNSALTARPNGYVSLDISRKKENVPVLLFNDVDTQHEPVYYDYIRTSVFPPYVYGNVGNGSGCDCIGGCVDNCFCVMKNGGEIPYDSNGLLLRGKPLIFECGPHCRCPPNCRNRVTQKGIRNRFEVFRSRETNWGVRSLDLIQAGAFICEFAGVVLTREQAQIFTMNGDSLVYPSRFSDRWAEWGDLSQIFSDYVRPSYPSVPPLDFALDVSRMRNVACYMSHSSTPNAIVQLVLYDHNNISFPHLMIFALENIPPLREISVDYGVADEWTGKLAICN